jgi:hypothetical protein
MRFHHLAATLDWKRAATEMTVIVAGVLIALGVDSCWGELQERERESAYLRQLLSDVTQIESELRDVIGNDSSTLARANRFIDAAFTDGAETPEDFGIGSGYSQFRPLSGTFTALIQSGDIHLIRDDSVRFRVIAFASEVEGTQRILLHTEDVIWRSTPESMRAVVTHTGRPDGFDAAAALRDPDVQTLLLLQRAASQNRIRNLRRLLEPTINLKLLLQEELGIT